MRLNCLKRHQGRSQASAIPLLGLWARSPAGCGFLQAFGQQGPTLHAGTFHKQITNDKVFYKQITDDKAGYGTKREQLQDRVTLFSLEETFSDLKWAMFDLQ